MDSASWKAYLLQQRLDGLIASGVDTWQVQTPPGNWGIFGFPLRCRFTVIPGTIEIMGDLVYTSTTSGQGPIADGMPFGGVPAGYYPATNPAYVQASAFGGTMPSLALKAGGYSPGVAITTSGALEIRGITSSVSSAAAQTCFFSFHGFYSLT